MTGTDGAAARNRSSRHAAALDTAVEQFQRRIRSPPRRLRRRAEVSASFGAAVSAARARPAHSRGRRSRGPPLLMATETLRAMALGGMRDHVGGGFHRYSVDGDWRVPHFEKMLYDQAQLVLAYLEAAQATGDDFYAAVAEDTLALRPARHDGSGRGILFGRGCRQHSAGARGAPGAHKSEGAFYIWSDEEMGALLGDDADDRAAPVRHRAGRQCAAAIRRESSPARTCCIPRSPIDEVAAQTGRPVDEVAAAAGRAFATRCSRSAQGRPRPHLDDKVLTAWNGLMIAAFARAARVLVDRPSAGSISMRQPGRRHSSANTLWVDGRLLRRYRDGDAAIPAYAEDYAFLIWGLLELFQAGGDAAVARVGADAPGAAGRQVLGRSRTAAGSARPARIRRFFFGSRKTTTAPSRRRAPSPR